MALASWFSPRSSGIAYDKRSGGAGCEQQDCRQPDAAAPYRPNSVFMAQANVCLDAMRLDRFAPGSTLYVKYDPADNSEIALVGSEKPASLLRVADDAGKKQSAGSRIPKKHNKWTVHAHHGNWGGKFAGQCPSERGAFAALICAAESVVTSVLNTPRLAHGAMFN